MNKLAFFCFAWVVAVWLIGCSDEEGASNVDGKHTFTKSLDVVTEAEVQDAQHAWGTSIVDIGRADAEGGNTEARAGQFVDALYALDITDVLFKPTMAEVIPFRTTREGVLSYFVANAPDSFPEDVAHGGFALNRWQSVRFAVAGNWYGPGVALSMGHYIFMDANGREHVAEFSFAYMRDDDSRLRIALHHSSFPFCGEEYVTAQACALNSQADLTAAVRSSMSLEEQRRLQTATLTTKAVLGAEQIWGGAVVALGEASATDVHAQAVDFVSHRYAYSAETPYRPPAPWSGPGALFKPTKARVIPFRTTLGGGVSYFVGGDANFAEDHGFALQPWTNVRFEAAGTTQLSPLLAITMGHYFFTATDGKEHKAEFSLAFVSAGAGGSNPLIALHHSSFPFCSTCGSTPETAALETATVAEASDLRFASKLALAGTAVAFLVVAIRSRRHEQQKTARTALLSDAHC